MTPYTPQPTYVPYTSDDYSQRVSEESGAMGKILRSLRYWDNVATYKAKGKLNRYASELTTISDEFIPDAKSIISDKTYLKNFLKELRDINTKISRSIKEGNRGRVWFWLRMKERKLRELENRMGKGVKTKRVKDINKAISNFSGGQYG